MLALGSFLCLLSFSAPAENLWDEPALQQYWLELLGLGEHNAFECVGEVDETRLAFYACSQQPGVKGKAMDVFLHTFVPKEDVEKHGADAAKGRVVVDYEALRRKFNHVYDVKHGIPEWIFSKVQANMKENRTT
jgi:hypothetical protein